VGLFWMLRRICVGVDLNGSRWGGSGIGSGVGRDGGTEIVGSMVERESWQGFRLAVWQEDRR
jgi:hypothetical protein